MNQIGPRQPPGPDPLLRAEVRHSRIVQAGLGATPRCAGRNPSRTPRRRFGLALAPRSALGTTTFALAPRSGAVPALGTTALALGATTLAGGATPALASRPPVLGGFPAAMPRPTPLWGPRPLPWRRARSLRPHWGPRSSLWGPRPSPWRGARCEKPSLLVAGGQNGRFFAVSEVRNGRFCRLFAYGPSGGANNRVF